MIPTCDLPQPAATPPSAIASFLHVLEPYFAHGATTFTTIDFIGRFLMTAVEGHQRLNELAADGLITPVPGQAVETWQLTRDGLYVLGPNRKRVTKKLLADVKACLASIGPELLRQGAVELSIGGRPVAGKPNGLVFVGLRLKNTPLAGDADEGLLQQLCAALDAAVGSGCYAPMLFADKVPLRMRDRVVVLENEAAARLAHGAEVTDETEAEQSRWRTQFRKKHGVTDRYDFYTVQHGLPWGLLNALAHLARADELPLSSVQSAWAPDDGAVLALCKEHADTFSASDRWDWPAELLGRLEYRAATNTLQKYLDELERNGPPEKEYYILHTLLERGRWAGLKCTAAHALQYYRTQLAEARAASARRVKPKNAPYFLLFFDTLNFPTPRLIGFVRQPAGHNAHVDALVDKWDTIAGGLEPTPSGWLTDNGFRGGSLALDVRAATPDEEAAFHELCKREGNTFRYLLFLPNHRMACRKSDRLEYTHVELATPPIFRTASLGRPIYPRLLAAMADWGNPTLRDVMRAAPPEFRDTLAKNIVFVDDVSMSRFARHASLKPCIDAVVLASELLDAWTFSSTGAGTWTARAGAESWGVVLTGERDRLSLTVSYGALTETYQLAPSGRPASAGAPYDDTLRALIGLLSKVRTFCKIGLDHVWEGYRMPADLGDDKEQHQFLALELSDALNGGRLEWGPNYVAWPDFPDLRNRERDCAES